MNDLKPITSPYLTVDQVAERYSVSRYSIWRWSREGGFPAPVRVGPNCKRWRLADIVEHETTFQAGFAFDAGFLLAS